MPNLPSTTLAFVVSLALTAPALHAQDEAPRDTTPGHGLIDLGVAHTGLSIGNSARWNGIRINWRDRGVQEVNGLNFTFSKPPNGTMNQATIGPAHAHPIPWTRQNIGHHIVRHNTISHCEQTGIVGSMGCAFSTIAGNVIHDIHVRRLFSGAEMAGIKLHGAIDTTIQSNHIYRAFIGLWLDWMAQGTRVSENLFHDNSYTDLLLEVNHGPCVVDNNLFLSSASLLDESEGGAFAYNLFAGKIISIPEPERETPYHPAHSTTVAGLANTQGGDNRFFNNLLLGNGSPVAAKDPGWDGQFGRTAPKARAVHATPSRYRRQGTVGVTVLRTRAHRRGEPGPRTGRARRAPRRPGRTAVRESLRVGGH